MSVCDLHREFVHDADVPCLVALDEHEAETRDHDALAFTVRAELIRSAA